MSNAIWLIGAIHLFMYAAIGTAFVATWSVWKAHAHFQLIGRIVQWHVARMRWKRRERDGLTDTERQCGEPQP